MFALYNELTNVLTKVDVLQCLQQLTVKDKDKDEKHHDQSTSGVKPLTLREDLRNLKKANNGNSLERRECMFPLAHVKRQKFNK